METVELLVESFYSYEDRAERERLEKEKEEIDKISDLDEEEAANMLAAGGKMERRTSNGLENTESHRGEGEDEEEVDPAYLNLEPENVVYALREFEESRKKKAEEEALGGTKKKKGKTMETEE